MEILRKHLSEIRIPSDFQNIYKDECVFSYDSPNSPTGIYVSLSSFLGFGEDFIDGYYRKTNNAVFLHIRQEKIPIVDDENHGNNDEEQIGEGGPERKITRLAIGVDGGFSGEISKKKFELKDYYNIVVLPERERIPYPNVDLPLIVQKSAEAVLASESAICKLEKLSVTGTWDGEIRHISKYAESLEQLNNGRKIPPSGWQCEKCDLKNNLWLNLTDGSILCGRKFFDGSGGNNHAVEQYKITGYPLAVKLGTITADGKADVFSYTEDDMVLDPKLSEHLAHFGINISSLEKSEKSMVELEIDMNKRIGEWSILTESDSNLVPLSGPGFTGMQNLGNSCYLNTVMQVLFSVPDFIKRFVDGSKKYFDLYPEDPANDFNIQMAKLGKGLWSGKYSSIAENSLDSENTGISPAMFKSLIGKNHSEFGTKQQQDAMEFFLHLINLLDRNSRGEENPSDALKFSIEDRVECQASKQVKYTTRDEFCLPITIPMDLATNLDEVKAYEKTVVNNGGNPPAGTNIVRPRITLQSCIDRFTQTEVIEQYYSTAIKEKTTANRYSRFATMPDYLLLHLRKFTLREDWVPIKLDVAIDDVDELDLSKFRSTGKLPAEELLPEVDSESPPPPVMDEQVLTELITMGFPPEACKKAVFHTQNTGLEPATQWIMEHIADPDFGDPFVAPGTEHSTKTVFVPNPDSLAMLMSMGFDDTQAAKALKATENNVERAMDWIFSHQDELNTIEADEIEEASSSSTRAKYRDGNGKYKLIAFISHMGSSSAFGHYVCHIRKDDQWVIYNDSKVAVSQNPPKDLGYLYLYQREN